jgi:GNAT superfamily N-acetyltransferase
MEKESPLTTSFAEFDGPRLLRQEELVASVKLSRLCFNGPEIDDESEIAANYVPPQHGGTYVLAHEDKPVSQIATFHHRLKMYDGHIQTASIGGVCTHPDYRGRQLASHLLEYCTRRLVDEGATLMLISGARGLYTHLGNVPHGRFLSFSINPELSRRWSPPADVVARRATGADTLICSMLYQAEPVHFVRRHADVSSALQDPVRNEYIYSDRWIVERSGQALAYLFLGNPYEEELEAGIRYVAEYAGSRLALAGALNTIVTTSALQKLTWPVPWQECELIHLLQAGEYESTPTPLDGQTWRIINFPAFMADLRPLLEARLDAGLLRGLHFEQSGPPLGGLGADRYAILRGSDLLELDGAAMTRLVLGNAGGEAESIHLPAALAEIIPALFPLPSFLPGLNYH